MSKYYTPSIEDFRYGFEYEFKPNKESDWIKCMQNLNFSYKDLYFQIQDCMFRVKYLCKEDIYSLGFKVVWNEYGETVFEKNKYRLFHNTKWEKHKTTIVDKLDGEAPFTDCPVLFTGEVKNKSELEKILNQIGYE